MARDLVSNRKKETNKKVERREAIKEDFHTCGSTLASICPHKSVRVHTRTHTEFKLKLLDLIVKYILFS